MTPEQLKASILQYAIQGKLVEQRPEEGTGEELYRQIQAEKRRLIKAGKIKKDKPLPEIAEDEIPFDIPESWRWCYVGDLFLHNTGKAQNSSGSANGKIKKFITTSNLYWGEFDFTKVKEMPFTDAELERCTAKKGDLLVCEGGDCGRSAVWDYDEEVCIQNHVHRLRPYRDMNIYYFYYLFYLYKHTGRLRGKGVAIQGLSNEAIHKVVLPLAPLEEQHRIVAKIEELLPYVDRYATAYEKLEQFNAKFPEDMKKSILQYAIQGKLVEQRPEEGTGEELYQQIQTEKQRLIKEGKIKKEKPLPEIAEDEIPFDIPESWKWVRLSNIAESIVDCPHSTPKYLDMETEYCTIDTNCIDEKGDITKWRYVDADTYTARIARLTPQKDDIVYTREGSICRAAILPEDPKVCLGQRVMLIRSANGVFPQFIRRLLMSPMVIRKLTEQQKGIGAKHVNVSDVCNLILPLPPLVEQKRIVAKLEEILPLCERLK